PLAWPQQVLFGKLIAAGLAVATVDYRHRAEWPDPAAAVRDVRAAIRYVRHYAGEFGIDASRVGIWGESAGGFLAAFAGLTGDGPGLVPALDHLGDEGVMDAPSAVQAVADWYGVHDLGGWLSAADVAATGFTRRQLAAASPLAHVPADGSDLPPFLLLHGLDDKVVPFDQSDRLHAALIEAGASSTLIGIPGADHVFVGADPLPLMDQTIAWLAEVLAA
ncbi:MAG: alpha/beta hydrolase, partial [Actinomycetia bacterium]|nr:alpha/beta hydrolase [Actinomycetes bacterium]